MEIVPLLMLLCLLIVMPAAPIWLFHRLRNSAYAQFTWLALLSMIAVGAFMAYFTVISFGGAFGIGAFMQCLGLPAGLFGLLLHYSLEKRGEKAKNSGLYSQWWAKGLVALLIFAYLSSPVWGFRAITSYCFWQNAAIAQPIIDGVERYKTANGEYPSRLEALVSLYLEEIPSPICLDSSASSYQETYTLERCRDSGNPDGEGRFIIWLDVVQGGFPQRYDFRTKEWSSISMFDGVCSYLN